MKITKHILTTLVLVLLGVATNAQTSVDRKSEKKLARALKKEARKQSLEDNKARIFGLVQNRTFVIEATTLYDRNQNRYEVSPLINFVKIEGDQGVVQFGFNHLIGSNGVGGLTVDGTLSGYKIVSTKGKGPVTITANLSAPVLHGPATVTLNILDNGTARATITGSFGSRLTFAGNFYDLEESRVYQGTTIL